MPDTQANDNNQNKTIAEKQLIDFIIDKNHNPFKSGIILDGKWGVGKTFLWNEVLDKNKEEINYPYYSYVSLFGISSVEELKKAIYFQKIDKEDIQRNSHDNIFSNKQKVYGLPIVIIILICLFIVNQLSDFIKLFNISVPAEFLLLTLICMLIFIIFSCCKIFDLFSMGELSIAGFKLDFKNAHGFHSIKNTLICIDDLERKCDNLKVKEIFGLLSYLKENHKCKIVLIYNSDKLKDDDKEFEAHKDKLFFDTINYKPSIDELTELVFSSELIIHENTKLINVEYQGYFKETFNKLSIDNLRIMQSIIYTYLDFIHKNELGEILKNTDKKIHLILIESITKIIIKNKNSSRHISDLLKNLILKKKLSNEDKDTLKSHLLEGIPYVIEELNKLTNEKNKMIIERITK